MFDTRNQIGKNAAKLLIIIIILKIYGVTKHKKNQDLCSLPTSKA